VNVLGIAEEFHLTDRERETVRLMTEGLTSKEIASRMSISPNTVKTFVHLIMAKMAVSTRSAILVKLLRS
jgi:two-component system nitrate/nitrite response regulator NarL